MKKREKNRWRKYRLRGRRLEEAAIRDLSDLTWTAGGPLTWNSLAERLGVTRQALATKPSVVDAFRKAKEANQTASATPQRVIRRTLEQRIEALEAELAAKNRELDRWVEMWVTVEDNCTACGADPDKILKPLGKPNRAEVQDRHRKRGHARNAHVNG